MIIKKIFPFLIIFAFFYAFFWVFRPGKDKFQSGRGLAHAARIML